MAESNRELFEKAVEEHPSLRAVLDRYDLFHDGPDHIGSDGHSFGWNIEYGDLDATFGGSFGFILPGVEIGPVEAHELGEQIALVDPSFRTKLALRSLNKNQSTHWPETRDPAAAWLGVCCRYAVVQNTGGL